MIKNPACAGLVDVMFPDPGTTTYDQDVIAAKAICRTCSEINLCRELNGREKHGVWFGTSEEDRRRMRRKMRR